MKISCIQMDMRLGEVNYNFAHAEELLRAAVAADQGVGSSSTRSTPPARAASARGCLARMAKSPRWTKFPLMQATTAVSAPRRRRTSWICQAWPRWKGLYSAITPATAPLCLLGLPSSLLCLPPSGRTPGEISWSDGKAPPPFRVPRQ